MKIAFLAKETIFILARRHFASHQSVALLGTSHGAATRCVFLLVPSSGTPRLYSQRGEKRGLTDIIEFMRLRAARPCGARLGGSMKLLRSLDDFPPELRGGAVAVGNFDGVHRGHACIVERLLARARSQGGPAIVFTFDPHPARILRPEAAPLPLIWTDRKIDILAEMGADAVIVYPTTTAFLEQDARHFFDSVVRDCLDAKAMVEGRNFFFGRNRGGNVETLRRFCEELGIAFEVAPTIEIEGQPVSSSRIRKALQEGRVEEAGQMLGRPYRLRGKVVRGVQRGRTLGFPTANVADYDTLCPPDGIYTGRAWISKKEFRPAALSVGTNPTFDEKALKVEAYLLDFEGDLYGSILEVDFVARLRDSMRFSGAEELVAQMTRDVETTRRTVA